MVPTSETLENADSRLGALLANIGCFFKHSCNLNVDRIFLPGPKVMMFSTRPIKKDEKVGIVISKPKFR